MKIKDMVEGRRYLLKDKDGDAIGSENNLTEIICLEISTKAIKIKHISGEVCWWINEEFNNYFEIFEDLGTTNLKENEHE